MAGELIFLLTMWDIDAYISQCRMLSSVYANWSIDVRLLRHSMWDMGGYILHCGVSNNEVINN